MPLPGQRDTVVNDGGSSAPSTPTSPIDDAAQNSGAGVNNSGGYGSYWDMLQAITDANNNFNLEQTGLVNAFNAHEAQKNRDWQERMSNTAHQREVKDLIKAGLNPVLSALNGQGAYTGSGATASGQKAVADNTLGNGMINIIGAMISASSAQSVANTYAAAQMYAADKQAGTQSNYQAVMKELGYLNAETSSANSERNQATQLLQTIFSMIGRGISLRYMQNHWRR